MPSADVQRWLARTAWAVPLGLLLLSVNQTKVAVDIRQTLKEGASAVATVTEYERIDRADVTYGFVSLSVPMEDGSVLVREKMSLPYTLMQELEGIGRLDVRVLRDSDQDVVIVTVGQTQWKIAAIQAAISFVAALIAFLGVLGWNRLLGRTPAPSWGGHPSLTS